MPHVAPVARVIPNGVDPARLGPGVSHLGYLSHPDLARAVGASGVALATPAWEEPFGLVAAEAMATGMRLDRRAVRRDGPARLGIDGRAETLDPGRWAALHDGRGAERLAGVVEEVAASASR